MEKPSCTEIDLDEWEYLPDDHGFLSVSHGGGKSLLSDKLSFADDGVVDVNYFICPAKPPLMAALPKDDWNAEAEDSMQFAAGDFNEVIVDDGVAKEFKDIGVVLPPPPLSPANNHVVISPVLYKELKESEFADMKMDSNKPQMELNAIEFNKEEEDEEVVSKGEDLDEKVSKNSSMDDDNGGKEIKGKGCCWDDFGISIFQWRLTGIGAICSIGVATATICIFIFGGRQPQKQHHQNQKLQFQIYADDKGIKQVVQHATRLNQALSAARGAAPMMTRAQISFGGYYNGL